MGHFFWVPPLDRGFGGNPLKGQLFYWGGKKRVGGWGCGQPGNRFVSCVRASGQGEAVRNDSWVAGGPETFLCCNKLDTYSLFIFPTFFVMFNIIYSLMYI